MPPLSMSIERKMFHITQIGVVPLTLTLCTGLFYMHNLMKVENIDKAVPLSWRGSFISSRFGATIMKGGADAGVVWFNVTGAGSLTLPTGSRVLQQFMSSLGEIL